MITTKVTKSKRALGMLCGVLAAVCYGTNPLGALKLYAEGMSTGSVLFYRFGLAWLIVSIVLFFRHESVRVSRRELRVLLGLGALFTVSSLTLYLSFHVMEAGVASTILFTYPVMTAVIMAVFFHERMNWVTVTSIVLSFVGVALLYRGDGTQVLPWGGVVLVLLSALTYAVYIIVVNRSKLQLSSFQINFYVLLCCAVGMLIYSLLSGEPIVWPHTATSWFYVGWLATVPAIMALVLLVYAARYAGSTTTAILGALEPLTAVLIGIGVFGEPFTGWLAAGIALILAAVILVASAGREKRSTD
ncbi:MAG: EamA family transporter [Bacteroidales bacterium]|nr:EamA family transporter [Bacteroidales bacterium]